MLCWVFPSLLQALVTIDVKPHTNDTAIEFVDADIVISSPGNLIPNVVNIYIPMSPTDVGRSSDFPFDTIKIFDQCGESQTSRSLYSTEDQSLVVETVSNFTLGSAPKSLVPISTRSWKCEYRFFNLRAKWSVSVDHGERQNVDLHFSPISHPVVTFDGPNYLLSFTSSVQIPEDVQVLKVYRAMYEQRVMIKYRLIEKAPIQVSDFLEHSDASFQSGDSRFFRWSGYRYTVVISPEDLIIPGDAVNPFLLISLLHDSVLYFLDISLKSIQDTQKRSGTSASFIYFGDHGVYQSPSKWSTYGAPQVTDSVLKYTVVNNVSFLHIGGDIPYAAGAAYVWDQYFAVNRDIFATVPIFEGIGNHELSFAVKPEWSNNDNDSHGECGVSYFHYFSGRGRLPVKSTLRSTPNEPSAYYSFYWPPMDDEPLIHFVALSSEHDFRKGSEQYQWLVDEFEGKHENFRKCPPTSCWRIVSTHRPLYVSQEGSQSDSDVSDSIRNSIESILDEFNVRLVLGGHWHSYQRSCSIIPSGSADKRTCDHTMSKGTVHLMVGTAGMYYDTNYFDPVWWSQATFTNGYGFSTMEVDRSTLKITFRESNNQGESHARDEVILKH